MPTFSGFPPGKMHTTTVPNLFFSELLPAIDDIAELKLTIYCFWALQQQEGEFRYVIKREVLADSLFMSGISHDPVEARELVERALKQAVARGTLLHAAITRNDEADEIYFMNTTRGRNALRAIEAGQYQPGTRDCPVALVAERPNIFVLYEQHIGPLSPIMSDHLRQAEEDFPATWIEEAIRIAVEHNKRSWSYIAAILKRWQAEGKDSGQSQQSTQTDGYKYIRGEYSDFIDY